MHSLAGLMMSTSPVDEHSRDLKKLSQVEVEVNGSSCL
jgi:hypothetical protein